MIDIKFRGKGKVSGEWVYGYYYKDFDSQHYILTNGMTRLVPVRVHPETVGRLSGLIDSTAVKWFEDDILCFQEEYHGDHSPSMVIVFHEGAFMRQYYSNGAPVHDDMGRHWYLPIQKCDLDMYTVHGNIHDNRKLLGQT